MSPVITSYSIHYTKLYEVRFPRKETLADLYSRAVNRGEDIRITSYNVCYTKLLRARPLLDRDGPPNRSVSWVSRLAAARGADFRPFLLVYSGEGAEVKYFLARNNFV